MDLYRIESHKLIYHVDRVNDWMKGEVIYPVYVEISPSGACNHRCTFCALDFMGYQKRFLETERIEGCIEEMGRLGVKSIMFGGEGEPLLHKDMGHLALHTKRSGIDVAFTTNGVFLDKTLVEKILGHVEWIKISCNAGGRKSYARIHRTKASDFDAVIKNIAYAAKLKHEKNYGCTLGMQLLLLPENFQEVYQLAETAKSIGMDYLVVKPYSQHFSSKTKKYKDIQYQEYLFLAEELARLNTDHFQVVFRGDTMKRWDAQGRGYGRCLALPFWCYLDASGKVWGCSAFLGNERFLYGNIYEKSFQEIWGGQARRSSLQWVETEMDVSQCRINCRMDKINQYLWELNHPPRHVNFI